MALLSMLDSNLHNDYMNQKALGFFSLTLLSSIAPIILITNINRLKYFITSLLYISVGVAVISVLPALLSNEPIMRFTSFGSNPILVSRVAGTAVLILFVLLISGKINTNQNLIVMASIILMIAIMLLTGVRTPLGVVLYLIVIYSLQNKNKKILYFIVFFPLIMLPILPSLLELIPKASIIKLSTYQEIVRIPIWKETINLIIEHPFGVGFCSFSDYFFLFGAHKVLNYPHNIILESFIEMGIVSGALFTALIIYSYLKLSRARKYNNIYINIAFLLFIFFLIQSMFSGDLNGNRLFFCFESIGIVILNILKEKGFKRSKRSPTSLQIRV